MISMGKSEISQYMENHKLVLVIQEIDEKKLQASRVCAEYYTQCGEKGGLNAEHYTFIRRVHVILDSSRGTYCAKNLHNRYHYQIPISKLWEFLKDASKQGRNIGIAGIEGFGKVDKHGRWIVPKSNVDMPDVILYSAYTPFSLAEGPEGPTFFAHLMMV